jgi:hypothetical protein
MKTRIASLIILALSLTSWTSDLSDWNLKFESEQVRIFKRKDRDQRQDLYRLEGLVAASIRSFHDFIDNTEEIRNWFPACTSAELLEQINDNEKIVRIVLDLPFPVRDRDAVVHVRKAAGYTGQMTYSVTNRPDYIPRRKGFVRVPQVGCEMALTTDEGSVQVIQTSSFDMGGTLPGFIMDLVFPKTMAASFMNIKSELE